jgi:excisionase family DNA binding protein
MTERTLTVDEAAQALGVTEKAVRRRIERGVLPSLLGPDRKRRIPASALGLDETSANGDGVPAGHVPRHAPNGHAPPSAELLDRLERLARENGQLRQIERVSEQSERLLIEANARIRELEDRLVKRRWWRR